MKLYESLPNEIRVGRRRYRVDLDFRNVLRMMDILQDDGLTTEAREYLAARCCMKRPKKGCLAEIRKIVFGMDEHADAGDHTRVTSFEQDAGLIRAAFWQAYGIDIYTARLHWFQFWELLQGLPEDTRYISIVGIRARKMPKPTKYNAEERDWLRRMKRQYALKETQEERERGYSDKVGDIFRGIMGMLPKAGD